MNESIKNFKNDKTNLDLSIDRLNKNWVTNVRKLHTQTVQLKQFRTDLSAKAEEIKSLIGIWAHQIRMYEIESDTDWDTTFIPKHKRGDKNRKRDTQKQIWPQMRRVLWV